MNRGDPRDPLLLQVLPLAEESHAVGGALLDPVGDGASERTPGLLHKYHGRALLLTTAACAIHCRYCFRQNFPYADSNPAQDDWSGVVATLASDASISELILSGGDPLSLGNARLRRLTDQLRAVPGLRRLRLHTRWPVVLPSRVDSGLLSWLSELPWRVTIVIHANHPAEIDAEVDTACAQLRTAGALLLNQSVLLAGINDEAPILQALSERLHDAGVLPYYLHLLDPVIGAQRFAVDETSGRALIATLRARLPGYLVPRLAREIAGEASKRVLA
jgi:EF-P beta-lysylation protein EpmB